MSDGSEIGETLTHKVGPIPGWGWVLIVGGGAWVFYLWRKRSAVSATPAIQQSASPDSVSGTGAQVDGILPSLSGSGIVTTANGQPANTSNAQWARTSVDQLIAGGADPTLATDALTTYLTGGSLTSAQQSIVNQALTKYGSPPEGLVKVNVANGPMYTVQQGDTFDSITQKFYGTSTNKDITQRLVAGANPNLLWNEKTRSFDGLTPGTVVQLPVNGIVNVQPNTLRAGGY